MSRALALATAVLFLAAATAAGAPDFAALDLTPYQPPRPAPAFSLPDLEGRTRTLADFHGKVLLLFFWATW
jgi:cytochrome oxidase Cu insertion factor (SCO1/SenC/PrrC family)